MALFFHTILSDDKCVEELQQYVSVNSQFPYKSLLPYINEVENQVIVPLIGQTTYDLIKTAYINSNAEPEGKNGDLLQKLQSVIAKLAMANATPFLELQFDANGVSTINKSESRTAGYDYQIQRAIAGFASSGNKGIEDLLAFLETEVATFTAYAASANYTANKAGLVKTAVEFSQFYHIANSRLTFNALRPTYLGIEEDRLKPLIGDALYTELTGTVSDAIKKRLLRACKKACVYQTIADALELQLPFEINADGLRVHYTAQYSNVRYFAPPSMAQVEAVRLACQRRADSTWQDISVILEEITPPTVATVISPIAGEEKFIAL